MPSSNSSSAQRFGPAVMDTKLGATARGLYCGAAGNVSLTDEFGATAVFQNVQAGQILPVQFTQINTAGTTIATPATNCVILY